MKRTQHRTALDEHDALPEHPQGLDPAEEAAVSQKRAGAHETLMQLGMDKGTLQNEAGLLDPHRRNAERQLARLQEVGYRRLQVQLSLSCTLLTSSCILCLDCISQVQRASLKNITRLLVGAAYHDGNMGISMCIMLKDSFG